MKDKYILPIKKHNSVLLLLFIFVSSFVHSQEIQKKHAILTDKFDFEIGVFYPSKKIDVGVDGALTNKDIAFGKAFGLSEDQTTLFFGSNWRFAKKWKLSFDYFGLKHSGSRVLEEDFTWDRFTFKEGTNLEARSGFNMYRIYFGRIFTQGAKHEFGGGLGVHAVNVKVTLAGDILINDGDLSFERSRKSITLPLPNIGLWYFYAPNAKLALIAKMDVFYIAIGDFSGKLLNITPGISYQFFKNIGASLHYRFIDIGAEFNSSRWDGDFNVSFYGPSLTINANF